MTRKNVHRLGWVLIVTCALAASGCGLWNRGDPCPYDGECSDGGYSAAPAGSAPSAGGGWTPRAGAAQPSGQ